MRRTKDVRDKDLQAFFSACERNGVSVSSTPKRHNHNSSVIVGVNGERYKIAPDMKIVPESRDVPTSAPGVRVAYSSSVFGAKAKKRLPVRGSHWNHVHKKRKKAEQKTQRNTKHKKVY